MWALTAHAQPVLYWYVSGDTDAPIEVGINDPTKLENPVLETTLKGPTKAGLHKLDLAKLGQDGKPIELQPGVKYEVVLTVAANDASGSANPTATCQVMRLDAKDVPPGSADEEDPAKRAGMYSKAGVWFDYIDALSAAIEADPKAEPLVRKRAKALAGQGMVWRPDGTITEQPAEKR